MKVELFAGELIVTVGNWFGGPVTVMFTGPEVPLRLLLSVAIASRTYEPTVTLFHAYEKVVTLPEGVSVAFPSLVPFAKTSTSVTVAFETVTSPATVRLVGPEKLAPAAGLVIVTIGLGLGTPLLVPDN